MEERYPNSEHLVESYYAIYLMYMRMKDLENAERYKQKLIQAFPASAYGVALADPNYLENMRAMIASQDSLRLGLHHGWWRSGRTGV